MSRLRVAVIGAGNIAQQHLPVLTNHPACEVAVLCDVQPRNAGRVGRAFRDCRAGGVPGRAAPARRSRRRVRLGQRAARRARGK